MTPRRIALLAVAVTSLSGCYRPNITDANLRCGDGGACPEGYRCGADRRCHQGNPMTCQPDAAVAALCTDQVLGDQCDPVCQQGCDCGRCSLKGDKLDCIASGNKARGDICNLTNDDCAPGFVCLREPCSPGQDAGVGVGRCYRFCASSAHCDGARCDVPIYDSKDNDTGLRACQLPPKTCEPDGSTGDCGSALLACYVDSSGRTFCECKGVGGEGQPCGVFTDCVAGFRCVQEGAPPARCREVCRPMTSSCTPPSVCTPVTGDPTFGFCTS
jgi:hypothetical protein